MAYNYRDNCHVQDIPVLAPEALGEAIHTHISQGWRLIALCGCPLELFQQGEDNTGLLCVLTHDATGNWQALRTSIVTAYTAFTPRCPQAHWFEREIYEQWGIVPQGHPWCKPIRFTTPAHGGKRPLPAETDYFSVKGSHAHEVAVGPVHAGVIEPGHFRFQCYGEHVMHLEISLGFQHRGVEALFMQASPAQRRHLVECVAGDTSIGHATAHAALIETFCAQPATARGEALRSIALELERLACHVGDLGALGGDVGFLPALSWCGRIRGDFLNMTALLCGNRFGRGMVHAGGTFFDVDATITQTLLQHLAAAHRDARGAVDVMLTAASVLERFENTGEVSLTTAHDLGLVGVAARASGLMQDARYQYPLAPVPTAPAHMRVFTSGDVYARAAVRSKEIDDAAHIIQETCKNLPTGDTAHTSASYVSLPANRLGISFVEGWRGTVCHIGISTAQGDFGFYKIIDPSFYNWIGLAMALRDQAISDFPLCNKSFNLSYCGHDL